VVVISRPPRAGIPHKNDLISALVSVSPEHSHLYIGKQRAKSC